MVGWMASQLVKLLPILCLFMIPSVLAVSDAKVHYLQDAGATMPSRIWHVYVRPNLPAHFALILLGWNLVINEGLINAAFQTHPCNRSRGLQASPYACRIRFRQVDELRSIQG